MRRLRIKGLTAFAQRTRTELSHPLDRRQLDQVRERVEEAVQTVDGALREYPNGLQALALPTRNAYLYLRGIDFDRVPTVARGTPPPTSVRVRFPGIRTVLEECLTGLDSQEPALVRLARRQVIDYHRFLETTIAERAVVPEQLSDETRAIRGWFALLARTERQEDYLRALERARRAFARRAALGSTSSLDLGLRPMASIYRLRRSRERLEVALTTPMIVLGDEEFDLVAAVAMKQRKDRRALHALVLGDAYRALQAELELLGGVVERAAGAAHDLDCVYNKINNAYFGGRMARPRLTWGRSFTYRKFGHYDSVRDTVLISASLDHPEVPSFVVEFVLYHELLHKKHGLDWQAQRAHAHTPAFRTDEARFGRCREAEQFLSRLARQLR